MVYNRKKGRCILSNAGAKTAFLFLALALMAKERITAADLNDPPVLSSRNGTLDVLMVARPQFLPFTGKPAGYVYEVCRRPDDQAARRCPVPGSKAADLHTCPVASDPEVSPYGGVRLHLSPGDTLRVRLVNCLPPGVDAKHAADDPLLNSNPTNLHTHGLIVEPRRADDADDPFGDYIFVVDLPHGVKPPAVTSTMPMHGGTDHARHFDFRSEFVDYRIPISAGHPPGLLWFHPHVHGISLNQVTGGLAGIITLHDPKGDLCDQGKPCKPGQRIPRHLVFKDIQITSDSRVRFQENPQMCPTPAASGQVGGCDGAGTKTGTAGDANDGRWEFSVNGQTYPEIAIPPTGDIWQMANASASASYNLGLTSSGQDAKPIVFQVRAIDGVSLVLPQGATEAQANRLMGYKVKVVACPGAPTGALAAPTADSFPAPVCATSLRMMPSARAEIFIPGDIAQGSAVLRTVERSTGTDGDDWPSIDLAHITFPLQVAGYASPHPQTYTAVVPAAAPAFASGGIFDGPAKTRLSGATSRVSVSTLTQEASGALGAARRARVKTLQPEAGLDCSPLPARKARQVLFGLPAPGSDKFGLGYRARVDFDSQNMPQFPLPPPKVTENVTIDEFKHDRLPTVCVQLARDNNRVTEVWVLVNLAREDHNFHIHQTRFSVLSAWKDGDNTIPMKKSGDPVLLDNVPIPSGGEGCDGTVDAWISGTCKPTFIVVSIPFHEVGDFVYHCHILEHEDGGMMAKITVVPHRG
jgi:FtsP/CotA-like multicopper oxidase with cupredoxin domain